ncbi:MAG: hypothetical protein IT185_09160 [Acidobacteria bacterium]|nr:hypothetical protein [Acidobacteriota bacterium]
MQDFRSPQPFNVEIGPEGATVPRAGVVGPSLPVVRQELTPEPDLYPPPARGVADGVIR